MIESRDLSMPWTSTSTSSTCQSPISHPPRGSSSSGSGPSGCSSSPASQPRCPTQVAPSLLKPVSECPWQPEVREAVAAKPGDRGDLLLLEGEDEDSVQAGDPGVG